MTIILIGIWGSLIYKVVSNSKSVTENDPSISVETKSPNRITEKDLVDSFNIIVGTRDPFLDRAIISRPKFEKSSEHPLRKRGSIQNKISNKNWPSVIYVGYVKRDGQSPTALIRVNEKLYRKKIKDTFDGLKLLKTNSDSIFVELIGGGKKYFVKKD